MRSLRLQQAGLLPRAAGWRQTGEGVLPSIARPGHTRGHAKPRRGETMEEAKFQRCPGRARRALPLASRSRLDGQAREKASGNDGFQRVVPAVPKPGERAGDQAPQPGLGQ